MGSRGAGLAAALDVEQPVAGLHAPHRHSAVGVAGSFGAGREPTRDVFEALGEAGAHGDAGGRHAAAKHPRGDAAPVPHVQPGLGLIRADRHCGAAAAHRDVTVVAPAQRPSVGVLGAGGARGERGVGAQDGEDVGARVIGQPSAVHADLANAVQHDVVEDGCGLHSGRSQAVLVVAKPVGGGPDVGHAVGVDPQRIVAVGVGAVAGFPGADPGGVDGLAA